MDDEALNISIRKFLKYVGVSSQREIEQAVAKAIAAKSIAGTETLPATMVLQINDFYFFHRAVSLSSSEISLNVQQLMVDPQPAPMLMIIRNYGLHQPPEIS